MFTDKKFIFIVGTSKAGTTTLHHWLASHPAIGASKNKETRFFLDIDYPLERIAYPSDNVEDFAVCFTKENIRGCDYLMDTTPDYMYCSNVVTLKKKLGNSKLVVILRDPVDRFCSWFQYAKQRGFVSENMSLKEFAMLQAEEIDGSQLIHCYALIQGRYENYLPGLKEEFGNDMLVLEFDDLKNNPKELLKSVCVFLGIDGRYYSNFEYKSSNVTKRIKFPAIENMYVTTRRTVTFAVMKYDTPLRILRIINKPIKMLLSLNSTDRRNNYSFDKATLEVIAQFYEDRTCTVSDVKDRLIKISENGHDS